MNLELKLQNLLKMLDCKIDINRLHFDLNEINNFKDKYSIESRKIFFSFSFDSNTNQEFKQVIIEQLEIAFQILINQGYKIVISNLNTESAEICKYFVDVFQSKSIKHVDGLHQSLDAISELYKSEFVITMNEENIIYSLVFDKPFISIFNNNILEKLDLKDFCINIEGFNAGILLDRLNYLKENNTKIKSDINKIFDEYREELTDKSNDYMINYTGKEDTEINVTDEMDSYKKQFKDSIQTLINQGLVKEAKDMVREYEKIAKNDVDTYSIKGVIAMLQGKVDYAEQIFKKGLELYANDFDLNYNIAYCYEQNNKKIMAIDAYKKAKKCTADKELKHEIDKILEKYSDIENDKKLLRSINNKSSGMLYDKNLNELQRENNEAEGKIIYINTDYKKAVSPQNNIYKDREEFTKLMADKETHEVIIMVLAYENLEKYTRKCVDNIIKHTKDIDYELVLIDNGSTDSTLEYFKTIDYPYKKIIRVSKNIGPVYGRLVANNYTRGRYVVWIPNDVIVTKNWLQNMIKCIESDERYGYVVPKSDNISNYQSVNLDFSSYDEMQMKAAKFNVSDPKKWEERLRLVNAVSLFKKECLDAIGTVDYGFIHDFGDDDITFRVRRAGYKAVLCGDVFVHHAGSVITGQNLSDKKNLIEQGRKCFKDKYFGIDAWDDSSNYDLELLSLADIYSNSNKNIQVLGIDVRCGTPILQLKNFLRAEGTFDTILSGFSQDAKYWLDLKTICEGNVVVNSLENLRNSFKTSFDYIVIGEELNSYKDYKFLIDTCLDLLKAEGQLLIKVLNSFDIGYIFNALKLNNNKINSNTFIDIDQFINEINSRNNLNLKIIKSNYNIDDNIKKEVIRLVKKFDPNINESLVWERIVANKYFINIKKST